MKHLTTILLATAAAFFTVSAARAADTACETRAAEKKLAGAARKSFLQKCERDTKASAAGPACEARAAEKKLAGAAKNSFVKKCVADAGK